MADQPVWDPWRELRRLQRDVEHLFDRGSPRSTTVAGDDPPINITRTPDGFLFVEALCPGADKASLEVTVVGDTLTIKGERKPEPGVDVERYHRRQRVTGPFTRTIRLGERIDPDQVQATYSQGILLLRVSRVPDATPKRIAIEG
jgi:HSP20 family protein